MSTSAKVFDHDSLASTALQMSPSTITKGITTQAKGKERGMGKGKVGHRSDTKLKEMKGE